MTPKFTSVLPVRQYGRLRAPRAQPGLLSLRLDSYHHFLEGGIAQSLSEMADIGDASGRFSLNLDQPELEPPERSPLECVANGLTYDAQLKVRATLANASSGEIIEQRLLLCRIPLMDASGGFIINGVRRVVIHQIVRAPGVWFAFDHEPVSGRRLGRGRISPARGSWIGFETNERDELRVRLNNGSSLSALTILRLFGLETDEELLDAFSNADADPSRRFIHNTIAAGDCRSRDEALFQVYAEVAPGAPPNRESAERRIERLFFSPQHYSLSAVGRHMLNRRFGTDETSLLLTCDDLVRIVGHVIKVSRGSAGADDIDHLANRRVRTAAELAQAEFETGLYEVGRAISQHLEFRRSRPKRPSDLLNTTPLIKRLEGFFNGSKLCQVVDETNPLAELTHKRRVTSLGPGGLNRQNAGVDPRDVHHTHYGKLCPIETPEGQNIGLLSTLTTAAQIDRHGLLTSPVRRVRKDVSSHYEGLVGRELRQDVRGRAELLAREGSIVTAGLANRLSVVPERRVAVRPYVSDDSADDVYLTAYQEARLNIAQCNVKMDGLGQFVDMQVEARCGEDLLLVPPERLDYIDLTPRQIVSASTALIPFLEHDDANRALMGCNMQRQAVPLLNPQTALVATGMEVDVARDSGHQVRATSRGTAVSVTADRIEVMPDGSGGMQRYDLERAVRSNAFTWIGQRPIVNRFQRLEAGQPIADGPATSEGELALGQRVLVAYMSWGGYNYEDAIIVSERVTREGKFRSRTLKKYRLDAMDTPLGPEVITRDVPDVADWRRQLLDKGGVAPVGAYVGPGQLLIGKATPRPVPVEYQDRERTPEEELLLKVFGKTWDNLRYQDSSRLLPKGQQGRVVSVKVIRRGDGSEAARGLPPSCHTRVEVEVAGTRDLQPGDKMSGRHGNKGCVSIIVPQEDMPFLPDGTPVDVILSPLGVPSRMNLGQLMEVHLGWAAHRMGFRARTPVFDSANWEQIEQCLAQAWLVEKAGGLPTERLPEDDACAVDWERIRNWVEARSYDYELLFGEGAVNDTYCGRVCLELWMRQQGLDPAGFSSYSELCEEALRLDREENLSAPIMGKQVLRDGRTGEALNRPVTVGYKYMLKLIHMVEDKMHARSTGTYSMITQQPLGGKSAGGGQRLGEMEVWGIEAYSAAHVLQEMVTVKSDDVRGREALLKAIMADSGSGFSKGTQIKPGVPDSFELLLSELKSLGLNPELIQDMPEIATTPLLRPEESNDDAALNTGD